MVLDDVHNSSFSNFKIKDTTDKVHFYHIRSGELMIEENIDFKKLD